MKSAFLIVAHGNFSMLKYLIKALDYKNNDMFLHIDKKCGDIDYDDFESITKYSHVECLRDRISVSWGGISQIESTLLLLKRAIRGGYDYYHLISGVDFPLLTNSELEHFLIQNNGNEFVGFAQDCNDLRNKLGYYRLFQEGWLKHIPFHNHLDGLVVKIQNAIKIRHYTDIYAFYKGCNWWSITDKLAKALVTEEKYFLRKYKYTSCSDEVFVQTFIKHHPELNLKLYDSTDEYNGCMRLIDWKRGTPYVFTEDDFEELSKSTRFFARKFNNLKVLQDYAKYKNKVTGHFYNIDEDEK